MRDIQKNTLLRDVADSEPAPADNDVVQEDNEEV